MSKNSRTEYAPFLRNRTFQNTGGGALYVKPELVAPPVATPGGYAESLYAGGALGVEFGMVE